jgi:hypothetical protein
MMCFGSLRRNRPGLVSAFVMLKRRGLYPQAASTLTLGDSGLERAARVQLTTRNLRSRSNGTRKLNKDKAKNVIIILNVTSSDTRFQAQGMDGEVLNLVASTIALSNTRYLEKTAECQLIVQAGRLTLPSTAFVPTSRQALPSAA